ncbi:MAG: hypothetical protein KDC98_03140, partial [Planctomycetes bacterium]|nr:hypothetical protein [Planctomycetota bacterium]
MIALRIALGALTAASLFAQAKMVEPSPTATGKVFEWKSAEGLQYQYYLPKGYDPAAEITLTFVLHGSNLDRRWGFANHEAGRFRADDLVVCPDGTTSNGSGGFNFLQAKSDLERLHALHEELKGRFKVRATLIYGHSQGSFFSFYYAGAYPADVQGVVGQASGVWIGTQATKKHHHQAIVLMHGTADPVVPYGQSVGGLEFYREANYPHVRLRSLDGWNHWPTQMQTEQQLAWCEGMTTTDPGRLGAAFTAIDAQKTDVDPVALYEVGKRVVANEDVEAKVIKAAGEAIAAVDACADKHVQAIEKSSGKKGSKLSDKPWVGHLPLFLRHFDGVAACVELRKGWQKTLDKQQDGAKKLAREFWQNREQKPDKAFAAGL